MKTPKIREIIEAVKALIKGPYTTKFPFEPHFPADGFRGKPEYYEQDCIGCGACAEVCPADAIEIIDEKKESSIGTRTLIHRQDICIYCGQCERNCTTEKGIKLTKAFELSTEDLKTAFSKIEKELIYCEHCGQKVACRDHLRWLYKKMGSLLFSNPTLVGAKMKDLDLIIEGLPGSELHQRGANNKMLCPNCRREILVSEQW
jgi:hydrogenase-4 component H